MLYRVFALLFVVIETLSLIQGYVAIREWLNMSLMCAVSMLMYPRSFFNWQTFCLFAYFGILMLFAIMGHTLATPYWVLVEIMVPLSCLSIINVFLYQKDFTGLKYITLAGLLIIAVQSFLTIPITMKDPDAVRKMVGYTINHDVIALRNFQKKGLVNFGLVHAFPLLCPLIVLQIKSKLPVLTKGFLVAVLLITYAMIVKASYATPLILSTVGIAASIFLTKNRLRNILLGVFITLVVALSFNKENVTYSLEFVGKSFFRETSIGNKIDDIITSLRKNETSGTVSGREKTYNKSWTTFFNSPVIGSMEKKDAGGHAYFVDRLAYFGLFGAVPFILALYFSLKNSARFIDENMTPHYLLGAALFFILGFIKNITGIENFLYLLVFLPGLCFLGSTEKKKEPEQIDQAGSGQRGIV